MYILIYNLFNSMDSQKQEIGKILDEALNTVNRNTRKTLSETFNDKLFVPVYDISLRNSKELALERLKKVISSKVVSIRDFLTNPENIFTVHEMV
jgi:acyl-CoA oxidase